MDIFTWKRPFAETCERSAPVARVAEREKRMVMMKRVVFFMVLLLV
jgi:hypothetical protein